ncbi:MAG TPA: hypothetical protein VGC07_03520 [Granulicella sp.]
MPEIKVVTADVREAECDVLVLKYAQELHGADEAVAEALRQRLGGSVRLDPRPGQHVLLKANGAVAAEYVLFVGVVPLHEFDYRQIRLFAKQAMEIVSREAPSAERVALTMHGVGYGLDERESFLAEVGGLADAEVELSLPLISIVERDEQRAERLRALLDEMRPRPWPFSPMAPPRRLNRVRMTEPMKSIKAGTEGEEKQHVFVAMPFSKEMEDAYVYGMQRPINDAGYLCERVDMVIFQGDVLERIKSRIETATLLVADLTGASANVYLEVGYAWGKGRPTLLLARSAQELKFDVRGQRCVIYDSIVDLERKMRSELAAL